MQAARKWQQRHLPISRTLALRIAKSTANSTVAFIFTLIPKVREHLGGQPAMLPLISVMVHPGRRVGGTIKGTIYCVTGLALGLAYCLLGRFLAQKCLGSEWHTLSESDFYHLHYHRYESAMGVLALFETIMLFIHGWLRAISHHYFGIAFPYFLVVHFAFMDSLTLDARTIAKNYSIPFYLGIAMSIFWNLAFFPEFGSTYLGNAVIDYTKELERSIYDSMNFFVDFEEYDTTLARLLKYKSQLKSNVFNCETIFEESLYEFSYSHVSPVQVTTLIPIFKDLCIYVNGLVNACQLEFSMAKDIDREKIKKLKPIVEDLAKKIQESLKITKLILAIAFDVDLARIGEREYKTSNRRELWDSIDIDKQIQDLVTATNIFLDEVQTEILNVDVSNIEFGSETFLLSSFLMNCKEISLCLVESMAPVKEIYKLRSERASKSILLRRKIWIPFLQNRKSMPKMSNKSLSENDGLKGSLNGSKGVLGLTMKPPKYEEDELLSQKANDVQRANDAKVNYDLPLVNNSPSATDTQGGILKSWSHSSLSNFFIALNTFFVRYREHFRFGFQVAVALQLSSFPMFVPKTRSWYNSYRGPWIGFVCILSLEPSVGGTFWVFFLRGVGVVAGASWAYLSYVAGKRTHSNYLETVITAFGAVPGFYFLLGTPYVKAAIIYIISIYVVILAAYLPSNVPGGILRNFAKRCLAVGYGGGVALIVQVFIFPIKARNLLNEEIAFVCGCISKMELLYATGLDDGITETTMSEQRYAKIKSISASAKSALSRAIAYKGLARQEPRLKGEYTEIEKIFKEVIFILQQIVERMDNMALLRRQHGTAILKEMNYQMIAHRRQTIATLTNLMRIIQESMINKTPLPQFLPSARSAHMRLLASVEKLLIKYYGELPVSSLSSSAEDDDQVLTFNAKTSTAKPNIDELTLKETFLNWNASTAAWEEIIEYVEELIALTKILVGVNEFKYGFLSRPIYADWAADAAQGFDDFIYGPEENEIPSIAVSSGDVSSLPDSYSAMNSVENPHALEPLTDHSGTKLNLARIASQHAGTQMEQLPKPFRNRAFSIGSAGDTGLRRGSFSLRKQRTLGDADPAMANTKSQSDSEEDLPLALKRIISRRHHGKNR